MEKYVLFVVLLSLRLLVQALDNPFQEGCLVQKVPGFTKRRVCNSDDPISGESCRRPDVDYMEIRIYAENWESVFFETWILQIILSELLDVPTTVETGTFDARLNFYDPTSPFGYGNTEDIQALTRATEMGDCRLASRDKETYQGCAHMVPEFWRADSEPVQDALDQEIIETPSALGVVAFDTWFMTKFTANKDPTLDSYLGLQGEENRRKLAETFLRPTTWKDYCEQVSTNNCTDDDGVAKRAPKSEEELDRMFVEGLFTGHFRATEKNDCDLNPNCTGHIADYPCGWYSFLEAQAFHLNIALESEGDEPGSRGYSYQQLLDMWDAANATKNNLMAMWWTPTNPQYHKYRGTDAEYHKVSLPVPTQECLDNRVGLDERCSEIQEERVGDPAGACEKTITPLVKLISTSLSEITSDPSIPLAIQSPAYKVAKDFRISGTQLSQILEYWQKEETPREALCKWASENLEYLYSFVPPAYPRMIQDDDNEARLYASTVLGGVATLSVLVVGYLVHRYRNKHAIRFAQIEFLRLLLAGSLLIAIGAILIGSRPTDGKCIATIWLINIGYTLELVPLIVKIAAINRLMTAARNMRRITVNRRNLFGAVAFISFFMVVFLILWSALDKPIKTAEYELTSSVTEDGHTVVTRSYYCSSDSIVWQYVAVGWNALLLLCATVLAVQTRNLRQDFNESRTLAFLIYSLFIFVILRLTTIVLSDNVEESKLRFARSLIHSVDTIATICIYFVPKLMKSSPENSGVHTSHPSSLQHYMTRCSNPPSLHGYESDPEAGESGWMTEVATGTVGYFRQLRRCASPGETDADEMGKGGHNKKPAISPCPRCGFIEGEPLLAGENQMESQKVMQERLNDENAGNNTPGFGKETKEPLVDGGLGLETTAQGDTEDDITGDASGSVDSKSPQIPEEDSDAALDSVDGKLPLVLEDEAQSKTDNRRRTKDGKAQTGS